MISLPTVCHHGEGGCLVVVLYVGIDSLLSMEGGKFRNLFKPSFRTALQRLLDLKKKYGIQTKKFRVAILIN